MGKSTQQTDRELLNLAIAEAQKLHDATGLSATRDALAHVIDCLEGRVPAIGKRLEQAD